MQVLNGACLEDNLVNWMPTSNALVGNDLVIALKDNGCSEVIVKRDLVKKKQLTGKIGYVIMIARTFLNVKVSCLISAKQ